MTKEKENIITSTMNMTEKQKDKQKKLRDTELRKREKDRQKKAQKAKAVDDSVEKEKNLGGRPAKYETPEDLEQTIEVYINPETCPDTVQTIVGEVVLNLPCPTVSGLAYYLGFESRQSMYDYEHKDDRFSYIIKKAKLAIERRYEQNLSKSSPTGAIFALKNMGWKDKTEVDNTHKFTGQAPIVFGNTSKPKK